MNPQAHSLFSPTSNAESNNFGGLPSNDGNDKFLNVLKTLKSDNWCWNCELAEECPVAFTNDDKTAIFHPEASFGTTAISGRKALKSTTFAYWEIHVPALFGSSIMFGIGKKTTKRRLIISFDHLLGANEPGNEMESFGLSHLGLLYGGKFRRQTCQNPRRFCNELENQPTTVGMLFNGPEGWLAYFIDGRPMGLAFTDIDASFEAYYPMVSSTSQRSTFNLTRQFCIESTPTLSALCLKQISTRLISNGFTDARRLAQLCELHLPKQLISQLSKIVLKQSTLFSFESGSRKRKPESNSQSVNTVTELLGDFSIEQLAQLWRKITEVFEQFSQPERFALPKRVRLSKND